MKFPGEANSFSRLGDASGADALKKLGQDMSAEKAKARENFRLRNDPWYEKLTTLFGEHQQIDPGSEFVIPEDCPADVGQFFIAKMQQAAREQGLEATKIYEEPVIAESVGAATPSELPGQTNESVPVKKEISGLDYVTAASKKKNRKVDFRYTQKIKEGPDLLIQTSPKNLRVRPVNRPVPKPFTAVGKSESNLETPPEPGVQSESVLDNNKNIPPEPMTVESENKASMVGDFVNYERDEEIEEKVEKMRSTIKSRWEANIRNPKYAMDFIGLKPKDQKALFEQRVEQDLDIERKKLYTEKFGQVKKSDDTASESSAAESVTSAKPDIAEAPIPERDEEIEKRVTSLKAEVRQSWINKLTATGFWKQHPDADWETVNPWLKKQTEATLDLYRKQLYAEKAKK